MPWIALAVAAGEKIGQGLTDFTTNRQNAAYASADAKQATLTANAEAARVRRQVAFQQSSLRAQAGAQGTTFTGSPMEVYLENAKQGELMAQDKVYAGRLKSRAFKIQRDIYTKQAWNALIGAAIGFGGEAGKAYGGAPTSGGGGSGNWSGATTGGGFDAWDSGGF
jgi:hypothetical protein